MPERRFPPPWSVEDTGAAFVVLIGPALPENARRLIASGRA